MVSKLQFYLIALCLVQVCAAPEGKRLNARRRFFTGLKSIVQHHSTIEKVARNLYNLEYYWDALHYFNKAVSKKNSVPEYFAGRGDCQLKLKNIDAGIADHRQAALLAERRGEHQIRLCKLLMQYDKVEEAKTELKELDHAALVSMAYDLRDQEQFEKAVMVFDEAILKQHEERDYQARGDLLRRLNRLDDVVSNFREAVSLPQYYSDGTSRKDLIQALFDTENFDDAAKEMRPLQEVELISLAEKSRFERKYKEAICFYTALIEKNPLEKYYRIRGMCRLEMDEPLFAIEDFKDATSVPKEYSDDKTRGLLIETLISAGCIPDAMMQIQLLKYEQLMKLGNKFLAEGKFKDALLFFTQAIEDYSYEICYRLRGQCYMKSGDFEKAVNDYRAAVSLPADLRDGQTDLILAEALLNAKMFADAKEEMIKRLRDSEILELGDTYLSRGKFEGAICCYDVAIRKRPSDPKLYRLRARCHLQLNDLDAALSDFRREVKHDPEWYDKGQINERSQVLLISELYDLGKIQRAEQKMNELDAWQLLPLGNELAQRNMFTGAEQAYSKAVDKGPSNSAVFHEKRAEFFRKRGSWHKAIYDYNEAKRRNPSCIKYMVELVELWLQNDNYRKAKEVLEEHRQDLKLATNEEADRVQVAREKIAQREREEEEARQRRIAEEIQRAQWEHQRRIQEEIQRQEDEARRLRQLADEAEARRRQNRRGSGFATGVAGGLLVGSALTYSAGCGGGGGDCGGGGGCGGGDGCGDGGCGG